MDNVTGHRWCPCPRRCDKTKRNETKGKERRTKGFKTGKLNRLGHLWCTRIIGHAYPWARVSFRFLSFRFLRIRFLSFAEIHGVITTTRCIMSRSRSASRSSRTETRGRDQEEPFYVVRGGLAPGIYRNWPDAVNAGWHQRQPFGNAVKCDSVDQAQQFIARPGKLTP